MMPDGHGYRGIAHEIRLTVICECGWVTGDCFDNLHEMNDHDPCDPCHLAWRVQCLEDDSHGWWNELDRLDSVDELAIRQSEQRRLADRFFNVSQRDPRLTSSQDRMVVSWVASMIRYWTPPAFDEGRVGPDGTRWAPLDEPRCEFDGGFHGEA